MRATPITIRLSTADINRSLAPYSPSRDLIPERSLLDYSPEARLTGKVAVVFGGSRGLGNEIALRLAKEGAHVAIVYPPTELQQAKNTVQTIERWGVRGGIFELDVEDMDDCEMIAEEIFECFGGIDIVVTGTGPFNMEIEQTLAFLPHLEEGACIISAKRDSGLSNNGRKKHVFTNALAQAMRERSIRVNFVTDCSASTFVHLASQSSSALMGEHIA